MCMRLPLLWSKHLSKSVLLKSRSVSVAAPKMSLELDDEGIVVPKQLLEPANVPARKLFGPGPSNLSKEVEKSLNQPLLGHLHAEFLKIMDDVREGTKYVFQTKNKLTFVVSGTGHAGMECALMNLLEQGEKILVVRNGLWGERAASLSKRLNFNVDIVNAPDGSFVSLSDFKEALNKSKPAAVFICQGESSTGVLHPLEGYGQACHDVGALFIVDTVASLGATPFNSDELLVDCVYSASQKVLNAPPGLAPISFSDVAVEKMKNRKTQVPSFYFDALELGNYWGCFDEARRYHHTGPVLLVYSLREALAVIIREGIEASIERHQTNAKILHEKLQNAGFELFVTDENARLPCLTTVKVPENVNWITVRDSLMNQGYEIAGGLGATTGKIWIIGTFGLNCTPSRFAEIPALLKHASKI